MSRQKENRSQKNYTTSQSHFCWKEEVIFSNVSLCCVLVLPRLACTDTVKGPVKRGSNQICVCVRRRQERKSQEERKKESLPVTRKSNRGKQSSISQDKCTPGRLQGETERQKKKKVMNQQFSCKAPDLQLLSSKSSAYFYSQLKQIAAMFQSPTSLFYSSALGCRAPSFVITPE